MSPDGRRAAVEIYRGDIRHNANLYRLLLFDGRAGSWANGPSTLLSIWSRERDNAPGIAHPVWDSSSNHIFALLPDHRGALQIGRLDLHGGRETLTASRVGIADFAVAGGSGNIAYLERKPSHKTVLAPATYSGGIVGGESIYALLQGRSEQQDYRGFGGGIDVVVQSGRAKDVVALRPQEWPIVNLGLTLSRDGRYLAIPVVMARDALPPEWHLPQPPNWDFVSGFRLFDRRSHELRWLVAAPTSGDDQQAVIWSHDGTRALLLGVQRASGDGNWPTEADVINLATGQIEARFPGTFSSRRPGADLENAVFDSDQQPATSFKVSPTADGGWTLQARPRDVHQLRIAQDMVHKPVLVEDDPRTGRSLQIFDPNPTLDNAQLNSVEQFHWISGAGEEHVCGLYFPRGYRKGQRYPLIIQTHGWSPDQFWYAGPSSAGFAAQSLAEAGFVVAQLDETKGVSGTYREETANRDTYDELIDALDKQGLIDIDRLGITAWSSTGLPVRYALATGRHRFRAALFADAADGGYLDYIVSPTIVQGVSEGIMGGVPFGSGLENWRKRSPMFNYNEIDTPSRILRFGPRLLSLWENVAIARRLGKPVEFIWLPTANHWPVLPAERMEAQQGAVDWYRFWLKDEIDPDPTKAAQYRRWNAMRDRLRQNGPGAIRAVKDGPA